MDENYLDNLLNEFSLDKEINHKIEDELDSQILEEKRQYLEDQEISRELEFEMDLDQESSGEMDSMDLQFSQAQIDELDDLDDFADLDIGDFDFSDIDFNDVDITKLGEIDDSSFDDLLKDFEGDLEIDNFFVREESMTESKNDSPMDDSNESDNVQQHEQQELESEEEQSKDDMSGMIEEQEQINDSLNEDTFDANDFLDSLLEETQRDESESEPIEDLEEETTPQSEIDETMSVEEMFEKLETQTQNEEQNESDANEAGSEGEEELQSLDDFESLDDVDAQPISMQEENTSEDVDSLDDLLSMFDMDGEESNNTQADDLSNDGTDLEDGISESADRDKEQTQEAGEIEEAPVKKKKTLMQILFGDPDEDDDEPTEEELEAIALKKAQKKEKKEAAKAAKKEKAEANKAKKALDNDKKKKSAQEKKALKAEQKKQKAAEQVANAVPEKKLNRPMVIFVFSFFLGGVLLFYVATNNFDYTQAIKHAANYFANQKYRKAYDEIVGIEVKEKDQELKDRIYTVMYVERLYESYNNNVTLGYEEKALDALLRGVDKYYEHYEEAKELGITSDLDYSFAQIREILISRYGITVEQAMEYNTMDDLEYIQMIMKYVDEVGPAPVDSDGKASTDNPQSVDAAMPDSQEDSSNEQDSNLEN